MLTIYRAHHPKAEVERLYLKRKVGGRGMIGIEDCINLEISSLASYVENSEELLLKAVASEKILKLESPINAETIHKSHEVMWKSKRLHWQFDKATREVKGERSWDWIKKI